MYLGLAPLPSDVAAGYDPFFDFRSMGGSIYSGYYTGETYAGGEQSPVGGLPAAPYGGVAVPAPGYTSTPGYTPISPYAPTPVSKMPVLPKPPEPVVPVTQTPVAEEIPMTTWIVLGAVLLLFLLTNK